MTLAHRLGSAVFVPALLLAGAAPAARATGYQLVLAPDCSHPILVWMTLDGRTDIYRIVPGQPFVVLDGARYVFQFERPLGPKAGREASFELYRKRQDRPERVGRFLFFTGTYPLMKISVTAQEGLQALQDFKGKATVGEDHCQWRDGALVFCSSIYDPKAGPDPAPEAPADAGAAPAGETKADGTP
jgi:hypothetical protein